MRFLVACLVLAAGAAAAQTAVVPAGPAWNAYIEATGQLDPAEGLIVYCSDPRATLWKGRECRTRERITEPIRLTLQQRLDRALLGILPANKVAVAIGVGPVSPLRMADRVPKVILYYRVDAKG